MTIPVIGTTEEGAASLRDYYESGLGFREFVAGARRNLDLLEGIHRRAVVPDDLVERARALPVGRHLLVMTEDWCGDGANTLPVIARLVESVPERLTLRIIGRDAHPELMDAHLTDGRSRSIPVVIALDHLFRECGWWGPRPTELQAWVKREGLALEKDERYRRIRMWYARDRGRTTMEELLGLLETCSSPS